MNWGMFTLLGLIVIALMAYGSYTIEMRDRRERAAEREAERGRHRYTAPLR